MMLDRVALLLQGAQRERRGEGECTYSAIDCTHRMELRHADCSLFSDRRLLASILDRRPNDKGKPELGTESK